MRVQNKVAIVTGAGSGIGRATAELLAEEGAKVVVADVDPKGGNETVSAIREKGNTAHFVQADISREAGREKDLRRGRQDIWRDRHSGEQRGHVCSEGF